MSQTNSIELNKTSFDKFSKRLYKELEKESELSLSKIKEITAKSLGFRNYSGINDYLNLPLSNANVTSISLYEKGANLVKNNQVLKRFSNDNIISVASILIKIDDMWGERALILLKTVLSLLDILNMEKNADNIREYILFDKLFACYKQTNNNKAKELILNYCKNMLPGFEENRYNDTAASQNSYLTTQIIPVTEFLKQVENKDYLMFSLDWLMTKTTNQAVDMEVLSQLPKLIKKQLESSDKWDNFLEVNGLTFHSQLLTTEAYSDSWLCDETFISIMTSKLITFKYKNFYFSDFLYNVSKIINTEKKKKYIALLQNIKHNYDACVQYSEELYNAVHNV